MTPQTTAKAPRRQQLPEEVASYVRELIISGQVKPGEFLRIEPISEALGVSNTPVREGLLSLRSQGFVQLARVAASWSRRSASRTSATSSGPRRTSRVSSRPVRRRR